MKSFVALLLVSSFTYLALSQSCATGVASCQTAPATLLAGFTAIVSQVSSIITGCNSGFVIANATGACTTSCGTGCLWCTNATVCLPNGCNSAGYAVSPNAGVCVACNSTTASANAWWCTQSAGTITVTGCVAGYGVVAQACVSCTAAATFGIPNCATCAGFTAGPVSVSNSTSVNWILCTACASGYALIPITTGVSTVAQCTLINTTTSAAATGVSNNNFTATTLATVSSWTNCTGLNVMAASYSSGFVAAYCNAVSSGWCNAVSTFTCAATQAGSPPNAVGGYYNGTNFTATTCATGFQLVASACYNASAVVTNCAMLATATTCGSAAAGYHVTSTGNTTACSATGCSSLSCATGMYLLANGTCATGAVLTNCLLHNSSSICLVCQPGYAQQNPTCLGCTANCVACNLSSGSNTTCATCGPNFVVSSGACTAAPATTSSNAKALLSGLAFISMIFYYVL